MTTVKYFLLLILFLIINKGLSATTLTLKPGPAAGKDAYLASGTPTTNFFNHPELASTAWTCSSDPCNGRGIFSFDLSSIPQNAVIISAQLSLYANTNPMNGNGIAMQGNNTSVLQRVTANWNETTVTWNNAPPTTTQNQVTLAASSTSFQNYLNIDVKNLVQDMVNNPTTSFGFLLKHVSETFYKSMIFASSDFPDPTKWPEITIQYEVLSVQPLPRNIYCQGSSELVNFTSSALNANNVFTVQLSDANSSFANPVNIGSINSNVSGSIPVVFPSNTPYGTGYRIRVTSSSPVSTSQDNGNNISFLNPDDNSVCTTDGCDAVTGLPTHVNINFSDNNYCTNDLCDAITGVYHTPVDPSDQNACTIDACDPALGIFHIPSNVTGDGNPCTNDLCDPLTGNALYIPVNVNDNNACTNDACDMTTGNIIHTVININDQNACTIDGCDFITGVYHVSINSDDGNQCTIDACNQQTGQISHTQISINDNDACTIDGCNSLTGVFHTLVTVDDNNACTIDACNNITGIISHTVINSNDQNACTFDGCDFITGVYHNMVNIDDGNSCTIDACDPSNANISHSPVNINDNNACTIDACDNISGVSHTPVLIDDQNACTNDACDQSSGMVSHTVINTNDNDACTYDGCDFVSGVFHLATPIDDQNLCTLDGCDPLTGLVSHTLTNIDDHNACTLDGCDYVTGVYHTPIATEDGNICTEDACDPLTGNVTHSPIEVNDNNVCTIDGCDQVTGIYHNTFSVDDQNSCTEDGCDAISGEYHYDHSPLPVVTYDPIACYGDQTCVSVAVSGGTPPYSGEGVFCNYGEGVYQFEVIDAAGCPASKYVSITQPSKILTNISTAPASCGASNGSAQIFVTGGTSPYHYLWSPGSDSTAIINGLSPGNYSVVVTDLNNCTTTSTAVVGVNGNIPSNPGSITGPVGACRGQGGVVYSVPVVQGAQSYSWTLPNGVSGISNSNSITVSFSNNFSGGFICVTAINNCGSSQSSCKNIMRLTSKPGSIAQMSGPSSVCTPGTATYCIPTVSNATNYLWSIGGNGGNSPLTIISGQGTTCITVNVPAGYNGNQEIKVKAENCLGVSSTRKKDIHKTTVPHTPGNINGLSLVCKSQSVAYSVGSVGGATIYQWSITGGAIIVSGQGTKNIIVNFSSSTTSSALLSVVASNTCGSSAASSINITINPNCKVSQQIDRKVSIQQVSVFPNPSTGRITVGVTCEKNSDVDLKLMDVIGKIVYHSPYNIHSGENQIELNFETLNKGIYFLVIEDRLDTRETIRVVIE